METRETVTLDTQAQQRLMVLTHVMAGELGREEALGRRMPLTALSSLTQ